MLYQLGTLKFQKLTGPTSFSEVDEENFVQMDRLAGKPTLQAIGGVLRTIEWGIRLHYDFVDPQKALNQIKAAKVKREALTLSNGEGDIFGDFVIQKLSTQYTKTDETGVLLIADLTISLKEFVSADPVSTAALAARKAAFASVEVKPLEVNPVPKFQSPESLVMKNVISANSAGTVAASNVKKASQLASVAKGLLDQAARGLATAKTATQDAKNGVDAVAAKISNAVALKSSMDDVVATISTMQANLTEANLPSLNLLADTLNQNLYVLTSVSAELSNVTVLRK